jgi:hypothetical protein
MLWCATHILVLQSEKPVVVVEMVKPQEDGAVAVARCGLSTCRRQILSSERCAVVTCSKGCIIHYHYSSCHRRASRATETSPDSPCWTPSCDGQLQSAVVTVDHHVTHTLFAISKPTPTPPPCDRRVDRGDVKREITQSPSVHQDPKVVPRKENPPSSSATNAGATEPNVANNHVADALVDDAHLVPLRPLTLETEQQQPRVVKPMPRRLRPRKLKPRPMALDQFRRELVMPPSRSVWQALPTVSFLRASAPEFVPASL